MFSFGVDEYREAASAISFWRPGVWTTRRGDDLQICCLSARARSKCPARSERAENFLAHATVDELSHFMPIWVWCNDGSKCSRTSQARNTPASSRSFMVMMCLLNNCIMSSGKSTDYTMYLFALLGGGSGRIHAPPAACLQEYV